MSNLLTDMEIKLLIKKTGWGIERAKSLNLVSNYKTVAETQDTKTREITLKAVGKWIKNEMIELRRMSAPNEECNALNYLLSKLFKAVEQGKMPDEV